MRALALIVTAVLAGTPAIAAPIGGCDQAVLQGNAFSQCLIEAERKSSEVLGRTVAAAIDSIATRRGVFDVIGENGVDHGSSSLASGAQRARNAPIRSSAREMFSSELA